MPSVELVHDADCPNAGMARNRLRRALGEAGVSVRWWEWDRSAPETPVHLRGFGSPTILVNGKDIAGTAALNGVGVCRIYTAACGQRFGVPSVAMITQASRVEAGANGYIAVRGGWVSSLALVPGTLAAFLPALSCPACWPAYAGLISSLGIGFLSDAEHLMPLTIILLAAALALMTYGAHRRRRYGPLFLSAAGSVAVVLTRFVFHAPLIVYFAVGLIVMASVWNALPGKPTYGSCLSCEPAEPVPSSTATTEGGL